MVFGLRQLGQVVEVGTVGLDRGTRPNGHRRGMVKRSNYGRGPVLPALAA